MREDRPYQCGQIATRTRPGRRTIRWRSPGWEPDNAPILFRRVALRSDRSDRTAGIRSGRTRDQDRSEPGPALFVRIRGFDGEPHGPSADLGTGRRYGGSRRGRGATVMAVNGASLPVDLRWRRPVTTQRSRNRKVYSCRIGAINGSSRLSPPPYSLSL